MSTTNETPRLIGFRAAMAGAWTAFRKHAVTLIVAWFCLVLVNIIGNLIARVVVVLVAESGDSGVAGFTIGLVVVGSLLINPALWGGQAILLLKAARDENPAVEDLFAGFGNYGNFLGASLIGLGIFALIIAPFPLCAFLTEELWWGLADWVTWVMIALSILISLTLVWFVWPRYVFAVFAVADGAGPIEAYATSALLTKSIRPTVLGILLLLLLVAMSGLVACYVGILVTAPLAGIALALVYSRLADRGVLPAECTKDDTARQ